MAEISKAHIFEVGTWNGHVIDASVLDSLAQSFTALALDGRVPLKLGHDDRQPLTDGQPAVGWVTKVWREGTSLFATFSGMPAAVFDAVKKSLYRFVSVEILRNVEAAGKTWPAVLDAVALLGADRPAVNLQALSKLAATRAERPMVFDALQAFSTAFAVPADDAPRQDYAAEVTRLTRERDDFKRKAETADAALVAFRKRIDAEQFTARASEWIRDRSITPAMRDLVLKRMKKDPGVAQTFSAMDLLASMRGAPGTHGFAPGLETGRVRQPGGGDLDNPVPELVAATKEFARQNNCDVFSAMAGVARARKDLSEPVMLEFQRYRESHGFRR